MSNASMSTNVRRTLAILTIAVGSIAGTIAQGVDTDLATLQQRVDRLEALTGRVEAISAIKRLQHAYGHYSELGLWHDFADLFADTGVGYYTQGALDREGIRALFSKRSDRDASASPTDASTHTSPCSRS